MIYNKSEDGSHVQAGMAFVENKKSYLCVLLAF